MTTAHWFWLAAPHGTGGIGTDTAGIVTEASAPLRRVPPALAPLGRPLNDVIRQWRARGAVRWERLPGDWECRA